MPDRPDVPAACCRKYGRCRDAPRGTSLWTRLGGPSPCYTPAVLKPSGTPREPRRSAIALASRIGRTERRPSDQTKAIRRSVGGWSGNVYPEPQTKGAVGACRLENIAMSVVPSFTSVVRCCHTNNTRSRRGGQQISGLWRRCDRCGSERRPNLVLPVSTTRAMRRAFRFC